MTVSWIYYCWTEHTQNVCTCMKQYFYMFHLCIFEHVLCVGEGTGRKSTSPTLCMLWENGQIMCIPMSVHQCCITQGKKQCFWSLIQALFPYTVGWSKNIQLLFIYFFHYRRVCEAIAQEDAESKGKNMTKTVLNI